MSNTYRGNARVGVILPKKIIGSCKTTAWYFILFENIFKLRQRRLAVLKYSLRLVCSLIFIEYYI